MNIPAHTKLTPAMVTTVQKPSDQVEADAVVDPADAVGLIASADIQEGAQLTPARLTKPVPVAQGLQIANGLRAITIAIDQVKGLAFLLKPGDHVDILASPPRSPSGPAMAFAIVRDARILAMGQQLETSGEPTPSPAPGAPPPPAPQTATLLVTPKQADTILAADLNSTVRLSLRPAHEPERSMASESIIYPTPAPPMSQPSPPTIPVVNGDTVTAVKP
jgi:pilus assembly protein CpaB